MTWLDDFEPLKIDRTRQTAPQVFDWLRALIMAVHLTPGTVLSRTELAAYLGVSQTPVRDALQRLSDEGLVDIYAQHATIVSRIDTAAALQVHFLRRSVEIEILKKLGELAEPVREELMRRLRINLKQQGDALDVLDCVGLAEVDHEFHRMMYEAAEVLPLWDLLRQKNAHIDRLRCLNLPQAGKARSIVADHTALVDALEKRDGLTAEQVLRRHLSGTLAFVDEIKTVYPTYVV